MKATWDILTTTIPHRHAALLGLLADLNRQLAQPALQAHVGVIVYRDNLTVSYGAKTRALLEASQAEYVSVVDDDDLLAPDGVARICAALTGRPDYVGFPVLWTRDGKPQLRVEHSLRHGGWGAEEGVLKRDISEKNPMRRELALLGTWDGGYEAEARWAASVRATGRVRTEKWLDEPVYFYRESTADTFKTDRQPWPEHAILPIPAYPWLTVLAAPGSC